MRTMLRGKISLLFMTCAVLLAIPAIALADVISGDADADALDTPHGNSRIANQQPGTTVSYDFDAYIRELGNSADNVFVNTGDNVKVSIARSGDWLASPAGTPNDMTFTKYTSSTAVSGSTNDNTQSGKIAVTVPCDTAAGTQKTMTVKLTGSAYDDGPDNLVGTDDDAPLVSGRQLTGTGTLTFTYAITAQGANAASCTPANSAPVIASDNASRTVDEGQTATNTGTWSDANAGDTVTLSASVGNVTKNAGGTWSWSYGTTDGPANSQTVTITATDNHNASNNTTFGLTVNNVAPTVSSVSASAQNALSGKNVTFTGSATDPSSADTTAGFFWQWSKDGGVTYTPSALPNPFAASGNTFTTSFADCGSNSVSAKASDKDAGTSAAVSSASVNVYNASYLPPLNEGMQNLVQKGRVIPVKISVGCDTNLTGLQPSIQLLKGDQAAGTESGTDNVETLSVSSADTTGIMRAIDGGYIYNLQVPSTAAANELYTIRVNPFGGTSASSNMYVVLKIRK
jgi:hypothetical protein